MKNYPFISNSAVKGPLAKSGGKKDTSESDRTAMILSKSARDLKKRDLFNAAKGVS